MTYKIYKESKLPDIGLDEIKRLVQKKINAHKNRHEQIYLDEDTLWFWHDEKRKSVPLSHIKEVKKTNMHGFGKMIKIFYRSTHPFPEGDKTVDLHMLNVENSDQSPEELAQTINTAIEEALKVERKGRKIHKFADKKKSA